VLRFGSGDCVTIVPAFEAEELSRVTRHVSQVIVRRMNASMHLIASAPPPPPLPSSSLLSPLA
jgi:hypothetical protein